MGAVIHKGRNKLAFGANSFTKTHALQTNVLHQYLHAEISALVKRRHYDDIIRCDMTVYRETWDGKPAMAKPCKQCQSILTAFGIKKVYYSKAEEPYFDILIL